MREKYPEYEAGQVWSGKEMRKVSWIRRRCSKETFTSAINASLLSDNVLKSDMVK
jgi:hypothetical protein